MKYFLISSTTSFLSILARAWQSCLIVRSTLSTKIHSHRVSIGPFGFSGVQPLMTSSGMSHSGYFAKCFQFFTPLLVLLRGTQISRMLSDSGVMTSFINQPRSVGTVILQSCDNLVVYSCSGKLRQSQFGSVRNIQQKVGCKRNIFSLEFGSLMYDSGKHCSSTPVTVVPEILMCSLNLRSKPAADVSLMRSYSDFENCS